MDIYQTVTNKIIAQLEAGVAPWVKPWNAEAGAPDIAHNAISGKPYRGINAFLLFPPAGAVGSGWMTFKQTRDLGANVRKGEKGQMIVFFKPWKIKDKNADDGAEKTIPVLRNFFVFHTSQIDNLPEKYVPVPATPLLEAERIAKADALMRQAMVHHGGDRAFYRVATDAIQLPEAGSFRTIGDYYATALHELTHWTGAKHRCNRDFTGRFGDTAYAREELVAEMGSAFLLTLCQITGEMQSASYIDAWLKVLQSDKRAIILAASAAQKAVDFIVQDQAMETMDDMEEMEAA